MTACINMQARHIVHHQMKPEQHLLELGCTLTFLGTFACYILYSATEQKSYNARNRKPLPLLTDMFSDWPLASSTCMGTGSTLLFTAMAVILHWQGGAQLATCSLTQASCWIMICTSAFSEYSMLHNASVLVFVSSSTYTLQTTNLQHMHTIAALIWLCLAAAAASTAFLQGKRQCAASIWQVLVASELTILAASGVGFFLVLNATESDLKSVLEPQH